MWCLIWRKSKFQFPTGRQQWLKDAANNDRICSESLVEFAIKAFPALNKGQLLTVLKWQNSPKLKNLHKLCPEKPG